MAKNTDRNVALLAIHPAYAAAILAGEKRVEFRKVRFQRDVAYVVVYSTTPVKRVVGFFEVSSVIEASPRSLWSKYRTCAGLSKSDYDKYYEGHEVGVAIEIGEVWSLPEALLLTQVKRGLIAPQSYTYLEQSAFRKVQRTIEL